MTPFLSPFSAVPCILAHYQSRESAFTQKMHELGLSPATQLEIVSQPERPQKLPEWNVGQEVSCPESVINS